MLSIHDFDRVRPCPPPPFARCSGSHWGKSRPSPISPFCHPGGDCPRAFSPCMFAPFIHTYPNIQHICKLTTFGRANIARGEPDLIRPARIWTQCLSHWKHCFRHDFKKNIRILFCCQKNTKRSVTQFKHLQVSHMFLFMCGKAHAILGGLAVGEGHTVASSSSHRTRLVAEDSALWEELYAAHWPGTDPTHYPRGVSGGGGYSGGVSPFPQSFLVRFFFVQRFMDCRGRAFAIELVHHSPENHAKIYCLPPPQATCVSALPAFQPNGPWDQIPAARLLTRRHPPDPVRLLFKVGDPPPPLRAVGKWIPVKSLPPPKGVLPSFFGSTQMPGKRK